MKTGTRIQKHGLSNNEILRLFKEAHVELVQIIEQSQSPSFSKFRREQLRAIEKVIDRLEKNALNWAQKSLPPIMKAGARETYEKIKAFDEKAFPVKFAGVDEEAVRILTQEAWLDFGNTMTGLRRDATRAALEKRKIQEKVLKGFIEGSSAQRTQAEVVKDLKKQGFTVLKAKNGFGRRFSLEHYSNMLVRTQNVTAYNLGGKSQMLASGRRYARIPTIRPDIDGDDICNEWERKGIVDLQKDPLPPFHPSCRHVAEPISFAELQQIRPDLYAKAVAYYQDTVG